MAAIFFVGLVAFPLLPVAPLPQVDFPTITVTAQYPGASPDTMASSVAEPLETQFSQINGLAQMTSMNVLGTSTITLQFDLNRNIDAASTDVLEAINAAQGQLPKNLPNQPTITPRTFSPSTFQRSVAWRRSSSPDSRSPRSACRLIRRSLPRWA
jgi:HAE1 family hydrophobic/amphiphilic exporter-1